jgi:hypothetical protein
MKNLHYCHTFTNSLENTVKVLVRWGNLHRTGPNLREITVKVLFSLQHLHQNLHSVTSCLGVKVVKDVKVFCGITVESF